MREAVVLLEHLREPLPQQQPQIPPMPPPEVEQEVWAILEEGLEQFDAPEQQQVDPEPLVLQPQQPLQVDRALIAYALAMLRDMELQ